MITSFFAPKGKKTVNNSTILPMDNTTGDASEAKGKRKYNGNNDDDNNKDQQFLSSNKKQQSNSSRSGICVKEDDKKKSIITDEVLELITSLQEPKDEDNNESGSTSWRKVLDKQFHSAYFRTLAAFIAKERSENKIKIFPPKEDIFSALNLAPFNDVKVVIVGQDPYHGPSQAHGLCFSVRKGVAIPPSLRNMYKELKNDQKITNFNEIPKHGYLEKWAKQGVLMLNTVLTVRSGQPNSHQNMGWEKLTDEILRSLDVDRRKKNKKLVFLLWGKPANKKIETALSSVTSSSGNKNYHKIISTSHPSPLGATKTKTPFIGSQCFSRTNDYLKELGYAPIDWNVD